MAVARRCRSQYRPNDRAKKWYRTANDDFHLVSPGIAAARFIALTLEESFALSFDALRRCFDAQNAGYYRYLTRSCTNSHLDFLGQSMRRHRTLTHDALYEENWRGIDDRLDLEAALQRLDERSRKVMTLRLRGTRIEDIAAEVGLSKRHTLRLLQEAERRLNHYLGGER
jgi:DNA-directed RNA polymerase specialized sigma24 family protein